MNKVVKAEPTEYKGLQFRSKLEARVALFFDLCKIKYQYEPDRLVCNGKEYNPDFYLPETDDYVEVKGERPGYEQEILKARSFVSLDGPVRRLIIISEIPDPSEVGMPHFPCYFASARNFYGDGIELGWYFFQDIEEGIASGHISRAHFTNPRIVSWNVGNKCKPFSIKPMSDREINKPDWRADLRDDLEGDYDRSMKAINETVFSAFAQARKADFTMRRVKTGRRRQT